MLRRLLHRLLGYKVEITTHCHPQIGPRETIVRRCWLSSDCTVRAWWFVPRQLVLNSDGTVTGLPEDWKTTWRPLSAGDKTEVDDAEQ